jgi:hypothetical protein
MSNQKIPLDLNPNQEIEFSMPAFSEFSALPVIPNKPLPRRREATLHRTENATAYRHNFLVMNC